MSFDLTLLANPMVCGFLLLMLVVILLLLRLHAKNRGRR